jgi:hypothetical protein
LGVKLALGPPTDKISTFSQKMFLPDYLGNDMSKATVTREGKPFPITAPAVVIFDAPAVVHSFSLTSPAVVILLSLLAIAAITLLEIRKKRRQVWLDVAVFIVFGIAGMILYFTTFISVMPSTKWNLNLVWASPVHFLFGILWMIPKLRPKLMWYLQLTSVILVLFLASMFFLPQTFHWLVVPLCLILLIRTGTLVYPLKRR